MNRTICPKCSRPFVEQDDAVRSLDKSIHQLRGSIDSLREDVQRLTEVSKPKQESGSKIVSPKSGMVITLGPVTSQECKQVHAIILGAGTTPMDQVVSDILQNFARSRGIL